MSPSCSDRGVGDAVADDLVDRRAHALREAVVVERARVGAALDGELVDVGVDLVGGDAGRTVSPARRSTSAAIRPGVAHALDDLGRLHARLVPARRHAGVGVRRPGDARRARVRIGLTVARQHPPFERLVAALVLAAAAAPAQVVRAQGGRRRGHGPRLRPIGRRRATGGPPAATCGPPPPGWAIRPIRGEPLGDVRVAHLASPASCPGGHGREKAEDVMAARIDRPSVGGRRDTGARPVVRVETAG